jgi:glycosyltransferase involved in cell wall biosynthesis
VADARGASLHIGVDARELLGQPTGVGRFLARVLQAWSESPQFRHRVSLFLPAPAPDWAARLGSHFTLVVDSRDPATGASSGPPQSQSRGTVWEQTRLPRLAARTNVDVLFCAGYTAPLWPSCPTVVVVHDVSFFAHPEWFAWRERRRRQWITRASARRAAVVITVSQFSADEMRKWLGVSSDRVRVIRHGSPDISPGHAAARGPVVLFVGSIFNRRHLPEMIAAFASVVTRVPGARLVLVGDNRTTPRQDPIALASAAGISASVEWRRYVDDEELNRLYEQARVFLFLSDYEGFAMTPLEALAHGAPSVLLDTPVAREVYGSAARYVSADTDRIADALVNLLTDEATRARLLADGEQLLRQSTWPHTAAEVLAAIEGAAARS